MQPRLVRFSLAFVAACVVALLLFALMLSMVNPPRSKIRISQALVTTVLGLVVAIPLLFLHSLLASRSKALIQLLEQQSAGLIALHLSGAPRRD